MNDTSRPGEERPANEIQPRTGELAGSVARASDAPLGLMDGPAAEAAGRFTTTENVGVRIVVDYLNAHGTRAPILDLYALLTGSRAPLAAPPRADTRSLHMGRGRPDHLGRGVRPVDPRRRRARFRAPDAPSHRALRKRRSGMSAQKTRKRKAPPDPESVIGEALQATGQILEEDPELAFAALAARLLEAGITQEDAEDAAETLTAGDPGGRALALEHVRATYSQGVEHTRNVVLRLAHRTDAGNARRLVAPPRSRPALRPCGSAGMHGTARALAASTTTDEIDTSCDQGDRRRRSSEHGLAHRDADDQAGSPSGDSPSESRARDCEAMARPRRKPRKSVIARGAAARRRPLPAQRRTTARLTCGPASCAPITADDLLTRLSAATYDPACARARPSSAS